MPTEEQYKKLIRQLQEELHRLDGEIADRDEKLKGQTERLRQSIPKAEHEKKMDWLRRECERKLSEILTTQPRVHNPHGAGRKRIATKAIAARVLELNGQGLSQSKIAVKVADEFNIKIKRTTVGEIVRGNYTPMDEE
jgi:cell division septum initiation protein DivIVA